MAESLTSGCPNAMPYGFDIPRLTVSQWYLSQLFRIERFQIANRIFREHTDELEQAISLL